MSVSPILANQYIQLPSLTSTERDALTAVAGMIIYNSTTATLQKYEGGAWVSLGSGTSSFADNTFFITDNSDATKKIAFEASGITTGTTRTFTAPDANITLVGTSNTQTLTNKTIDANNTEIRLPSNTSSLTTTEAYLAWQSTRKLLRLYDGSRERGIGSVGFAPYAYQMGLSATQAFSTSSAIAANGGTFLIPIMIVGHMLLESVSVLNKDTTSARTWGWDLYEDRSSASNSVDRVANSSADETFTAAAASVRTITASSAPVYLAPGYYWLALQNRHASNTFALGADVVGGFAVNHIRFKTTTNPNGSTLDIVTSWTNTTSFYAARLNGRSANSSGAIL